MILGTAFLLLPSSLLSSEAELFLVKKEKQSWAPFRGNVFLHHTHHDGLIAVPSAPLLQDIQALWIMDINTFLWGKCVFLHKQNRPLALSPSSLLLFLQRGIVPISELGKFTGEPRWTAHSCGRPGMHQGTQWPPLAPKSPQSWANVLTFSSNCSICDKGESKHRGRKGGRGDKGEIRVVGRRNRG